jgi:hypothetical protein
MATTQEKVMQEARTCWPQVRLPWAPLARSLEVGQPE